MTKLTAGTYDFCNLPDVIRKFLADSYSHGTMNTLLRALTPDKFYLLFVDVAGVTIGQAMTSYANSYNMDITKVHWNTTEFELTDSKPNSSIDNLEWETGFVLTFPQILREEDKDFVASVVAYQLSIARLQEDAVFTWENDWTLSVLSCPDESHRSDPDSVVFDELEEALTNGSPVRSRSPNTGTRLVNPAKDWQLVGYTLVKI